MWVLSWLYTVVVKFYYNWIYPGPKKTPNDYKVINMKINGTRYFCILNSEETLKEKYKYPTTPNNIISVVIETLPDFNTKKSEILDCTSVIKMYSGPNGDFWGQRLSIHVLDCVVGKYIKKMTISYSNGTTKTYGRYNFISEN
jgi:hypothetical protein